MTLTKPTKSDECCLKLTKMDILLIKLTLSSSSTRRKETSVKVGYKWSCIFRPEGGAKTTPKGVLLGYKWEAYGNRTEKFGHKLLFQGGAFLLTVGVFLLAVELLCLQSLKALVRHTFPL